MCDEFGASQLPCSATVVVVRLAKAELQRYGFTGWLPTFVTDAGGNVRKALAGHVTKKNKSRSGGLADWGRCACHIMHNVVSHGFQQLKLRAPTTEGIKHVKEGIER